MALSDINYSELNLSENPIPVQTTGDLGDLSKIDYGKLDLSTKPIKKDKESRRVTAPIINPTNVKPTEVGDLNKIDYSAIDLSASQTVDKLDPNIETEKVFTNIDKQGQTIDEPITSIDEKKYKLEHPIDTNVDEYAGARVVTGIDKNNTPYWAVQSTYDGRILEYFYDSENAARGYILAHKLKEEPASISPTKLGESLYIPEGKALKLIIPLTTEDKALSGDELGQKLFFKSVSSAVDIMSGGLLTGAQRQSIIDKVYNQAVETGQFGSYRAHTNEKADANEVDKYKEQGFVPYYFENRDYIKTIRDGIFKAKEDLFKQNPELQEAEENAKWFEDNYGYDNYDTVNESLTNYVQTKAWNFKRGLYKGLEQTRAIGFRTAAGITNLLTDERSFGNPVNIALGGAPAIIFNTIEAIDPNYYNSNIKPYLPSGHNFGVYDYFKARENAIEYTLSNLQDKDFLEKFTKNFTVAGANIVPIVGLTMITKNPAVAIGFYDAIQSSADKEGAVGYKQLLSFGKGYAMGKLIGATSQFGKVGSVGLQTLFGASSEAIQQSITKGRIYDTDSVIIGGVTQGVLDLVLSGKHADNKDNLSIYKNEYDFTKNPPVIPNNLPLELQGTTRFNDPQANKILGLGGLSQQYGGVARLNVADARKNLDFLLSEVDNYSGKDKIAIENAIDDLTKGLAIQVNNEYLRSTMRPERQLTGTSYSKEDIDNLVFLHDSIAEVRHRDMLRAIENGDLETARKLQQEHIENALLAELYSRPYNIQAAETNPDLATDLLDRNLTVDVITNRPDIFAYNTEGYKKTTYPREVGITAEPLDKEAEEAFVESPETATKKLSGTLVEGAKEFVAGKYIETGKLNKGTTQSTANLVRSRLIEPPKGLQSSVFGVDLLAKKGADLAYLAAFHIEDFYRRGIEPTLDKFIKRINSDFGVDFVSHFSGEQIRDIYNKGLDYYNSNNADPFYSKMKQEVVEKLPNRFDKKQALAILKQEQFKSELNWTTGLEDWVNNQEGKISKDDLVKKIQENQVKVEEIKRGEGLTNQEEYKYDELDNEYRRLGQDMPQDRYEEYQNLIHKNDNTLPTKWDLDTYTNEKLELEGGVKGSSREILLINPIKQGADAYSYGFKSYIKTAKNLSMEEFFSLKGIEKDKLLDEYATDLNVHRSQAYIKQDLYTSNHWDEKNVLAHIRIKVYKLSNGKEGIILNEIQTSEGKEIPVAQELQSDWNQEGFKEGYKGDENPRLAEIQNLVFAAKPQTRIIGGVSFNDVVEVLGKDVAYEFENLLSEQKSPMLHQVPKNPFMGKDWKELSIKRIIRWAAENGYDEIGWTTARQQQERYFRTLSGKKLEWSKNEDGTYDLVLYREDNVPLQTVDMRNMSYEDIKNVTNEKIADEIKSKEALITEHKLSNELAKPVRRYNLEESITIGGKGGFEEYDTAYKNIFNKIAKRYGSEYKVQDINTKSIYRIYNENNKVVDYTEHIEVAERMTKENIGWSYEKGNSAQEQIHTITITPSLKQAALKEGFPLYGTSPLSSIKTNQPIGIRNTITDNANYLETKQSISNLLNELHKSVGERLVNEYEVMDELTNGVAVNKTRLNTHTGLSDINPNTGETIEDILPTDSKGVVLNSGLNPKAFIDQAKLLYKGVKDLGEFTSKLVHIFGNAAQSIASKLYEGLQKLHNDERGVLILNLFDRNAPKEFNEFEKYEDKSIARAGGRMLARMTFLQQINPQIRAAVDGILKDRAYLKGKETQVLAQIHQANNLLKGNVSGKGNLAEVIYYGNENTVKFRDIAHVKSETGFDLDNNEFKAYQALRNAQELTLDLRQEQLLIPLYDLLGRQTPNSKEAKATAAKIATIRNYYVGLKESGYISLQRGGKYAISAIDPSKPIGSNERLIYSEVNSRKELKNLAKDFLKKGYEDLDLNTKINDLAKFAYKLTPAQFERVIVDSGADPFSPEVEALRKEIRSRASASSYTIKRNFIRGYDISYDNAISTIARQFEVYKNAYYKDISRKVGLEGIDNAGVNKFTVLEENPNILNGHPDRIKLNPFDTEADANSFISSTTNKTRLIRPDKRLNNFLVKYIEAETSTYDPTITNKILNKTRTFTYLLQLGFDASQFVLNSVQQQFAIGNAYFARNGLENLSINPEIYFARGYKLAGKILAKEKLGLGNYSNEIQDFYKRAESEGFLQPAFEKSLVASETGKQTKFEYIADKAGVFMKAGERVGRTQTFAEAYLVGKEKLKLKDEQLYNYITDAIDNINQRFSKGENPQAFRGQFGKLVYQFNAYTSAYFEHLALAMKYDFRDKKIRLPANTLRVILPIAVAGGLSGLPFYQGFRQLHTLLSGEDWEEGIKNQLGKNSQVFSNLVLYGASTKKGVSNKLGMNFPIFDNLADYVSSVTDALHITRDTSYNKDTLSKIPAAATVLDTAKGVGNLALGALEYKNEGTHDRLMKAVEQTFTPKGIKNVLKANRYRTEGVTDVNGEQILDPTELSFADKLLQNVGVAPQPVLDYYDEKLQDRIKTIHERLAEKFGN